MPSLILPAIGLQIALSWINSRRGTKVSRDNLEKQHNLERRLVKYGIASSREQYDELCSVQKKIALESQEDRIAELKSSLLSNLENDAYSRSLANWPLQVPPFVMKRNFLSFVEAQSFPDEVTMPVHCIMTTSMNNSFNEVVLPELEQLFGRFVSKYWSTKSNQNVIFYQNCWESRNDCGSEYVNIHEQLKDVPCMILSPEETSEDGWRFRLHMWIDRGGMSENNLLKPTDKLSFEQDHVYTCEDKEKIISAFLPLLALIISNFADRYYWLYYSLPPRLPQLITEYQFGFDEIDQFDVVKEEYKNYLLPTDKMELPRFSKSIRDLMVYIYSLRGFVGKDEIEDMLMKQLKEFTNDSKKNFSSVLEMSYSTSLLLTLTTEEIELLKKLKDYDDNRTVSKL